MKSLFFAVLFVLPQIAPAADGGFSVSSWKQEVQSAALKKDVKALKALTDLPGLEGKVLAHRRTDERKALETARSEYAVGHFAVAREHYDRIPKGSDFWLEAVEEKGWSFHREKSFEKAIAQTKTLLSKPFLPIVGSEPFFLQSLSQLKICDYKGVLETHRLFKETQRERLILMQNLAKSGVSAALDLVISRADRFPLTLEVAGEETKLLPRLFYRDLVVQKSILRLKLGDAVEKISGLPSSMKETLLNSRKEAKKQLSERMKELASQESEENFKIVQKLNLIEVETIQRIHTDLSLDPNSYSRGRFKEAGVDDMVFPDDGHPWMDELDKYQVQVNSCPQNLRRRM
jgi:hypothetical protein